MSVRSSSTSARPLVMVRFLPPICTTTGACRTSRSPRSSLSSLRSFFGLPSGFPELPLTNRPCSRAGFGAFSLAYDMFCSRQAVPRLVGWRACIRVDEKCRCGGLSGALRGVAPLSRRYLEKYRITLASWRRTASLTLLPLTSGGPGNHTSHVNATSLSLWMSREARVRLPTIVMPRRCRRLARPRRAAGRRPQGLASVGERRLLAGQSLPALDRHVDVARLVLNEPSLALRLLGRDQGRARAAEAVENDLAALRAVLARVDDIATGFTVCQRGFRLTPLDHAPSPIPYPSG